MKVYRSHLMFPSDEPRKYEKALASGADAVSADLEDAIPADRKDAAMGLLVEWLQTHTPTVDFHVRINKGSDNFKTLSQKGVISKLACVVVPKVESPKDVLDVTSDFPVFVVIEEAMGVMNMEAICALPNVRGMILGRADMSRALGLTDRIADLSYIRQRMAVVAHAYGKQCLDCSHIIRDEAYIYRTWRESASYGMTGGACMHPLQVTIAKEVFTPSNDVITWCQEANAGFELHKGRNYINEKDGGIVGLPHKRAADKILKR